VNDTEPTDAGRVDLFVSHAGRDRAWAEWVAWELQQAGYRVELDYWDWEVGENFVAKMRDALERAGRMVALFSEAYFEAERYTTVEWTALLTDRDAARPRLLPFRIENVKPPRILGPLLSRDLLGCLKLRHAVCCLRRWAVGDAQTRSRGFLMIQQQSDGRGPRLPGSLPRVRNLPLRNVAFTGRDGMIVALRDRYVFARAESVALLRRHLPRLADADADRLAEALGDLALGVAQAAALLAETGMSASDYLNELADHAAQITAEGTPSDYPVSLAAAVRLSSARLDGEDLAAGQLLRLCAFWPPNRFRWTYSPTPPTTCCPNRSPRQFKAGWRFTAWWAGSPALVSPGSATTARYCIG
jgi:TIR domain